MNLVFLISGAIVCGIIYIAIFGYAISEILKIYPEELPHKNDRLGRLILAVVVGLIVYGCVFTLSQFIKSLPGNHYTDLSDFIKDSNAKIFGLILATLIAQFLSSFFNRQSYGYQSKLANNKAKADRIEAIIKTLGVSMTNLSLAMVNLMQYQSKVTTQVIALSNIAKFSHFIQYLKQKRILKKSITVQQNEILKRLAKINDENNNWMIELTSVNADFNSLNFSPLISYTQKLNQLFGLATDCIATGDIRRFNDARNYLNAILPYRNVLFIVLLNLANAAREGQEVDCPSEKQLDDFTKYKTELDRWINSIRKRTP